MMNKRAYKRMQHNRELQREAHMHASARGLYQGLPAKLHDQAMTLVGRVQMELDEALNEAIHMQGGNTARLADEMADVVICSFSVCQQIGIDLALSIEKKNAENKKRHFEELEEDAE